MITTRATASFAQSTFLVADSFPGADRIIRYDVTTGEVIDPQGDLFVASNPSGTILRFDSVTGTPIDVFVGSTVGPADLAQLLGSWGACQ